VSFTTLQGAPAGSPHTRTPDTAQPTPTRADDVDPKIRAGIDSPQTAASRLAARHARDKDDLVFLLRSLDLPATENDLAGLLPYLPNPAPNEIPGGIPMPEPAAPPNTPTGPADGPIDVGGVDAMTRSVALSMYYADDPMDRITTATGLTQAQIGALVDAAEADIDKAIAATGVPVVAVDVRPAQMLKQTSAPDDDGILPAADAAVWELIRWGEQHPAKGMQAHAARARAALAELGQARQREHAVTAAEAEVDRLRRQLAQAEQQLRNAKHGKTRGDAAPAQVPASAPPRLPQPADKAVCRQIRVWARERGFDCPDRGLISQQVLQAWEARDASPLAKAS
jgi:hypothetical protein